MTSQNLRFGALAAATLLLAAACSSSPEAAETTTTSTTVPPTTTTTLPPTTTTVPETTTTTEPPIEVSGAINGLPADDDAIERRVIAVKIDNHIKARPQSALQSADVVWEILVEGGATRFIAMFHQSDLDWVGPNRSGRPTDSKVMSAFGEAPLQLSGAQSWVKDIFDADDINVIWDFGVTTFRVGGGRVAPHNLFTSTELIRTWADDRGWDDESPGNLFAFGEPSPTDAEATRIEVQFSDAAPPTWAWDGEQYRRFHGTTPHEWVNEDGDSGQVAFDTLIVMKMRRYLASDPAGEGSSVPAVDTVGKGEAFVFHNGEVVGGSWERGSKKDPFYLTTVDGDELVLPPGRIWIMLQPDNRPLVWE